MALKPAGDRLIKTRPSFTLDVIQTNATLPCASSRVEAGYQLPYSLSQPTGGGASCPPVCPKL